ncbi:MAG: hypothetical protein V7711_14745 [Pseudomonadales bacterium]
MKIHDLLQEREIGKSSDSALEDYCIHLSISDAAKLQALTEMYPGTTTNELLSNLIGYALDEVKQLQSVSDAYQDQGKDSN